MQPQQRAWMDQEDARLWAVIREHGWSIEYIGGGVCSAPGCDGGDDDDQGRFPWDDEFSDPDSEPRPGSFHT